MSTRAGGRWLRCYPRAWRDRYGDELAELVTAMRADGQMGWLARLDLVRGGARERLRASGLGGGDRSPCDQARAGVLLVLCSWVPFLVGGAALQRFSENWAQVTPGADRAVPGAAYDTLIAVAVTAGLLVVTGIALALPRAIRFVVDDGGTRQLRGPLARAALATIIAVTGFVVVLLWSHNLDSAQRNGGDIGYELAFTAFAVTAAVALATWTAVAVRIAQLIELPSSVLRIERLLAALVSVCMAGMVIATALWWGALAHTAPWALHDDPAGTAAPLISAQLLIGGILMAGATAVAATGVVQALRAGRPLSGDCT